MALSTQSDLTEANDDVLIQIRRLNHALVNGDGAGFVSLLRLLHAILDARRIAIEIRRGSFVPNLSKLNRTQRGQLLNYAERWGASDVEIRRVTRSLEAGEGKERSAAVAASSVRLRYRREIAAGQLRTIPLIAIGAHCLAWTLPNRWGLRPATNIPQLFNPLSLAAHRPQFIVQMLESDFTGYLEPKMLKTINSTNGYSMVARTDGGALWNHCIGPYWTGAAFRRFHTRMNAEVERLRAILDDLSIPFRVFLLHLPSALDQDQAIGQAQQIAAALRKRVAGAHALLAIDTNKRDQSPTEVWPVDPYLSIIRAPIPAGNYQWPMAESYNSEGGLLYERSIANAIRDTVLAWNERAPK